VNNTYGFRARIYFATALLNIVATILLVPQLGLVGAAFSTAAAMFIGSGLVMNWFYWKRTRIDIPRFWKQICRIALPPFVLFAATFALYNSVLPPASSWPALIAYLLAYVVAYLVVCWLFSFNDYEKSLFRQIRGALIRRG
jgi:O-antigen/teichoic acid export membrane protein